MEENSELTELERLSKQKMDSDKRLLRAEVVIGTFGSIFLLSFVFLASFVEMPALLRALLIVFGFALCVVAVIFCIRIEQVAGFYECSKCHYKYVPTYKQTAFSMHKGRTRKMRCPKCTEKCWHKKVLS